MLNSDRGKKNSVKCMQQLQHQHHRTDALALECSTLDCCTKHRSDSHLIICIRAKSFLVMLWPSSCSSCITHLFCHVLISAASWNGLSPVIASPLNKLLCLRPFLPCSADFSYCFLLKIVSNWALPVCQPPAVNRVSESRYENRHHFGTKNC